MVYIYSTSKYFSNAALLYLVMLRFFLPSTFLLALPCYFCYISRRMKQGLAAVSVLL